MLLFFSIFKAQIDDSSEGTNLTHFHGTNNFLSEFHEAHWCVYWKLKRIVRLTKVRLTHLAHTRAIVLFCFVFHPASAFRPIIAVAWWISDCWSSLSNWCGLVSCAIIICDFRWFSKTASRLNSMCRPCGCFTMRPLCRQHTNCDCKSHSAVGACFIKGIVLSVCLVYLLLACQMWRSTLL